ncbi:MAG TPA: hypothetical protein VLC91_06455, partial [Spongiibacteraceae bacterium]|nr:hypothetical protein [Spongiibacteraceae bacterium]
MKNLNRLTLNRLTFNRLVLTAIALAIVCLSGCVQIASIPSYARAGDTVVLGLGGINRNWHGEKPKNLQITITDSAAHTYTLKLGTIFQAYPDYLSATNYTALSGDDGVKLQAYDGGWFIAAGLTNANSVPLPLALGSATLHITADNYTAVVDDQGQLFTQEGNLASIPLEILAGAPSNTNATAQFGAYDNNDTHFVVRPSSTSTTTLGGAYYVINYQTDSDFGVLKPMFFPVSRNPFVKMDYKLQQNSNGTGTYYVYIYNPSGFTASSPRDPKQGSLQDLSVNLEYYDVYGADAAKANFSLDTANSYFIDSSG